MTSKRSNPLRCASHQLYVIVGACICTVVIFFTRQFEVAEKTKILAVAPIHLTTSIKLQSAQSLDRFNEVLNEPERSIFVKLLKSFIKVVPTNVTYFLYGGTLLGSYRHHGMIPWDDDLDLCVRNNDKGVLLDALTSLEPEFKVDTKVNAIWKFYHNTSVPTRKKWGSWPFIDIFFYVGNESHIWDTHPAIKSHKYAKVDVFPLTPRPFMGELLPAPHNLTNFLQKFFDLDMCASTKWSHKRQESVKVSLQVPCQRLKGKFPFVRRIERQNSTLEVLEGPGLSPSNSSVFVVHHK